jgi:hypothetical protein
MDARVFAAPEGFDLQAGHSVTSGTGARMVSWLTQNLFLFP